MIVDGQCLPSLILFGLNVSKGTLHSRRIRGSKTSIGPTSRKRVLAFWSTVIRYGRADGFATFAIDWGHRPCTLLIKHVTACLHQTTASLSGALLHVRVKIKDLLRIKNLLNRSLECTKRKRRCDKEVPCGRCRRLKVECTRETVRLRNLSTKHSDEIAFLQSLKADIVAGERPDPAVAQKINDRIAHLEFGNGRPNSQVLLKPNSDDNRSSEGLAGIAGTSTDSSFFIEQKDTDAFILNALEYMAWGRSSSGCYPHRTCSCAHNRGLHTSSFVSSDSSLLANLPRPAEARRLVEFHLRHITWHHNCLHSTTFLEQCESFWETEKLEHPLWLALYLSVLSVSLV